MEWHPSNAAKTKQITVDGIVTSREASEIVTYKNNPLYVAPESESVFYLGFWATPNGNMQAAKDLVFERTLRAKETIQGHPLDPKQVSKAIGNSRSLATAPWNRRELERLDRYWRQGYKTTWKLNKSTAKQPWTTPKNMGSMGYTTTLAVLSHALHAHVERCMKAGDVASQLMKNDLNRAMQEWLCASQVEMTLMG